MSPGSQTTRPRASRVLPPQPLFRDRAQAGRILAHALDSSRRLAPLVVGVARSGLPVAREVALFLGAPLVPLEARALALPEAPRTELAGFADGGGVYLDPSLRALPPAQLDRLDAAALGLVAEISRSGREVRGGKPLPSFHGRRVILVDDGLGTGIAMAAAADTVRRRGAVVIIGAAPVASTAAIARLQSLLDEVVCPVALERLETLASCYREYYQVTELEALALLETVLAGEEEHSSPTY